MLRKCTATPSILRTNYAALSITSRFPYPTLCEASHNKGQMQLYLGWLDKYERQDGEESPVGLILCSESGREEIELLKLDRDGIVVAEYWTALPSKKEFVQKIHAILAETRERMARRNLLLPGNEPAGETDDWYVSE